jgi:cytochrome c-type biogenesis protein CcmH
MTLFWLIGAALAAFALALVLRPLLSGKRAARAASRPSHNETNVSIYRDQLRELEADRAAGKLAADDYASVRA